MDAVFLIFFITFISFKIDTRRTLEESLAFLKKKGCHVNIERP
jgi:hypothetical protein